MSSSLLQVRVDDELKAQAASVYEELGIDLPTAVRMFLKRSVMVNGIPFGMTLPKDSGSSRLMEALRETQAEAQQNGTADMTLEEINEEISAARRERDSRRSE